MMNQDQLVETLNAMTPEQRMNVVLQVPEFTTYFKRSSCLPMANATSARRGEKIKQLQAKLQEFEDLICSAAPLMWAFTGDIDGASAWEKRAVELLERIKNS